MWDIGLGPSWYGKVVLCTILAFEGDCFIDFNNLSLFTKSKSQFIYLFLKVVVLSIQNILCDHYFFFYCLNVLFFKINSKCSFFILL